MVVNPTDGEFGRILRMIRDMKIALLTTVDREGHFHARPVQTLGIERDRSLWFFTDVRSEKAFELARDVRLGLGYADPQTRRYVAVAGTGRMLRDTDKARELWTVEQRAYYPEGPEDEHLVLLRVRIERAEYWVSGGRTAHLLAALRARITGIPAAIVGRNSRIP
jgi:general stress protein 26